MFKKLKAFTMAEAILVMTILGIIATIMISTLKPAEYKDKALKIMAKKVMSEIDVATTQILMHHSVDGTFTNLKTVDGSSIINIAEFANNPQRQIADLYKKYLTAIRRTPTVKYDAQSGAGNLSEENPEDPILTMGSADACFVLKDGASMAIYATSNPDLHEARTIFPGETTMTDTYITTDGYYVVFDTNDGEGPNVWGKDRFAFFVDAKGIAYEAKQGRPHDVCMTCTERCFSSSCGSCGSDDDACIYEFCSSESGLDCNFFL